MFQSARQQVHLPPSGKVVLDYDVGGYGIGPNSVMKATRQYV